MSGSPGERSTGDANHGGLAADSIDCRENAVPCAFGSRREPSPIETDSGILAICRMGRKRKTKTQSHDIEDLVKRIAELERRASGTMLAAVLSGVGAVLTGLGNMGIKVEPTPSPPPPQVQTFEEHRKLDMAPSADKPPGSPPDLKGLIDYLGESSVQRAVFAHGLRELNDVPYFYATDPSSLKHILWNNGEPEDIRAMAALHAGASGNIKLAPELESIASEGSVVGAAANVALKMLKDVPTLAIPVRTPPTQKL